MITVDGDLMESPLASGDCIDGKTSEINLSQARRLFAAIELDTP